jgi:hypothetical protein
MKQTIALLALLLTGCATVPSTHISLPTKAGLFQIDSPKETSWTNVVLEVSPDGTVKAHIGAVSAHNDASVIATVAAANAQMADKLTIMFEKLMQATGQGAGKALTQ